MNAEITLPLAHPGATLENVGGKGASLARLVQAGLPVPDGFHLTTAAYRLFVASNDLQPRILDALQNANTASPESLEAVSAAIRLLFEAGAVPHEIAQAIDAAYSRLADPAARQPVSVAVRSSATAEDLPEASFAGQQETYLNVRGLPAVLAAVKNCWASLWTARAIGYRARQGISPQSVALAVVIQVLAPAEAAGILFTANPVTGRRGQAMISAAWGLGEAVVGGLVTPDTLLVEKATGAVVDRQTADKQVQTVLASQGVGDRPVAEAQRRLPVLNDHQAAELTRLGVQIEALFGLPVDIEWALAGEKFAILQARPITALPDEEAHVPTKWPLPRPKGYYARGSLAEHLPNPVTPLFKTLGLRLANIASRQLMEQIGGKVDIYYEYAPINDYIYLGIELGWRETWFYTKMALTQTKFMFSNGIPRWKAAREVLLAAIAKWEARDAADLTPEQLMEGANQLFLETARFYTVIQASTLPISSSSEIVFGRVYKLARRKGDPEPTAFLFGFDTSASRAEKALFDMATWAKGQPALAAYLQSTPASILAADLQNGQLPDALPAELWSAWRLRFADYLKVHGSVAYELDFSNPTPGEAPEPLLDVVKMYLQGQGNNPHERQRAAVELREQATQAMLMRLRWPLRGWFEKSLRWAQEYGPAREDSLADLGMALPLIRRLLGVLGRRLVLAGAIREAEDIYWLEETELVGLVNDLQAGRPLEDMSPRLPARRAEWRAVHKAIPPAMLPEKSWMSKIIPWSRQDEGEGQVKFKGMGTSGGVVTATARILYGPEDFPRFRPGDVLVAVTTTPAWTPLFAMASAVVTDIGGPLSHSSIVAREFGIPAVMATGVATRRIRDGQTITVDGRAGVVTLNGS